MSALFSLRFRQGLQGIQSELAFESWHEYPQFNSNQGLGRVALLAFLLGLALGIHFVMMIMLMLVRFYGNSISVFPGIDFLGTDRLQLLIQWCLYVVLVCSFHLLEFFTTAIYNPNVATADGFLVNHSPAYTAAALLASTEFILKFILWPSLRSDAFLGVGIIVVVAAQCIRSVAMKTCGESFNHLIQTAKKENHLLVKHGIYKYIRHPSYVGFFYWAVGTQLVLNNYVNIVVFAIAVWWFFRVRIPYEEESLLLHFGDEYMTYAKTTYICIPFIQSSINGKVKNR